MSDDVSISIQTDGTSAGVLQGKGTRRRYCTVCGVLVVLEALDTCGRCEPCANQRGLFPVKPWRRRRGTH